VLAGGGGRTILLSTGVAAAITESISMGAIGYTSTVAYRDYYTATTPLSGPRNNPLLSTMLTLRADGSSSCAGASDSRRTARPGRGDHHGQSRALARHGRAAASISARAEPPVDHVFVRTARPKAAAAVRIGAELGLQKRAELAGLLRGCFARVEPWLQAGKYVSAVASGLAKRNGWTIAEQAGDRTPDKTQRLLNRAAGDTFAAMGGWCGGSRWRGWMRRLAGRGAAVAW
jgi:hypothetical protein